MLFNNFQTNFPLTLRWHSNDQLFILLFSDHKNILVILTYDFEIFWWNWFWSHIVILSQLDYGVALYVSPSVSLSAVFGCPSVHISWAVLGNSARGFLSYCTQTPISGGVNVTFRCFDLLFNLHFSAKIAALALFIIAHIRQAVPDSSVVIILKQNVQFQVGIFRRTLQGGGGL